MNFTVRLYGAFRNLSSFSELEVQIPFSATVADIKAALERSLEGANNAGHACGNLRDLLSRSALADEMGILSDSDPIQLREGVVLSLLPPVCGG